MCVASRTFAQSFATVIADVKLCSVSLYSDHSFPHPCLRPFRITHSLTFPLSHTHNSFSRIISLASAVSFAQSQRDEALSMAIDDTTHATRDEVRIQRDHAHFAICVMTDIVVDNFVLISLPMYSKLDT